MSRAPLKSDFPSSISQLVTIVSPPVSPQTASSAPARPPANILILLHGLGDTPDSFTSLGAALQLPETACISLRGPASLPFGLQGFHWGDDIEMATSGTLDPDAGFTKSRTLLHQVVEEVLVTSLGYPRRAIFFLGFGQGGMAALDFASLLKAKQGEGDNEYGGVISIGGPLPHSSPSHTASTPVLLVGSERGSLVTSESEKRVRNVFSTVRMVRWKGRTQDGMMKTREEARDLMEFLASRLRSWAGTEGPGKGLVEVGGGSTA
ncbi:Alpha/Beta hydrolase protein [Peziza echinospora]|nr:Alpha/Beta hydrolase protein [Peziza echinospora]